MSRFTDLLESFFYLAEEEVRAPFELAALGPEEATAGADELPEEFLAFELEGETYVVPILVVREVIKVPALTEIPRGGRDLLGVINIRGEVLAVFDVKQRLRLVESVPRYAGPSPEVAAERASRIVILKREDSDVGFLVDRVRGVVRFRVSTLEAPPPGGSAERELLRGLGRSEGELFIVLDVEALFS